MSAIAQVGSLTLLAAAAMGQFLRVKPNGSNKAALAGASDRGIGVLNDPVLAADDPASIAPYAGDVLLYMVASEAISREAKVYAAASGKVAATGTIELGVAFDAAGANGDVIRVQPSIRETSAATGTTNDSFTIDSDSSTPKLVLGVQAGGTGDYAVTLKPPATLTAARTHTLPADSDQTLVGATATQTLTNKTLTAPAINSPTVVNGVQVDVDALTVTAAMSGQTITNEGASGTGVKSLPAATAGLNYRFRVMANQELRIDPNGSETIALPSTGAQSGAGKYITADAIGEYVEVECVKAGQWEVGSYRGTWSVEP